MFTSWKINWISLGKESQLIPGRESWVYAYYALRTVTNSVIKPFTYYLQISRPISIDCLFYNSCSDMYLEHAAIIATTLDDIAISFLQETSKQV